LTEHRTHDLRSGTQDHHPSTKTRCRKPYAATQHLMLLMMGVCTQIMCDICLIVRESVNVFVYRVRSLLLLAFGPTPKYFWTLSIVCGSFVTHNIRRDIFVRFVVSVLLHFSLLFYLWYHLRRLPLNQ